MLAQLDALSTCQPLTSRPGTPGGVAAALAANDRVRGAATSGSFAAMVEPMLWLRVLFISASDGSSVRPVSEDAGGACVVLGAGASVVGCVGVGLADGSALGPVDGVGDGLGVDVGCGVDVESAA